MVLIGMGGGGPSAIGSPGTPDTIEAVVVVTTAGLLLSTPTDPRLVVFEAEAETDLWGLSPVPGFLLVVGVA